MIWILPLLAALSIMAPAPPQGTQAPQVEEWTDDFNVAAFDEQKWERFTFEGNTGGSLKQEDGQLKIRGMAGSRSGIRSKAMFSADRFIFEAKLAKVTERLPEPGSNDKRGFAILAVLFGGTERNRVEWILRSDGGFEAWLIRDGRPGERLDNQKLATKEKQPMLAIVRRGSELLFMLNGEVGLSHRVENLPRDFRVMLYGFGGTETHWDSVRVVAAK